MLRCRIKSLTKLIKMYGKVSYHHPLNMNVVGFATVPILHRLTVSGYGCFVTLLA